MIIKTSTYIKSSPLRFHGDPRGGNFVDTSDEFDLGALYHIDPRIVKEALQVNSMLVNRKRLHLGG